MKRDILPGRRLTVGITFSYLTLMVLLPLAMVPLETAEMGLSELYQAVTAPRALASYGLSFGASLAAAAVNLVFGTVLAWVLVRYRFVGRGLIDALVDIPFALPTAVAGIALAATFGPNGLIGEPLARAGVQAAYSRLGVVIALVFVSLPFTVRAVQPVLEGLDPALEEAAATLGASAWQSFRLVAVPHLRPALVTGFALSFARSLGEYGSVVFISGNMPMQTEITPLLIMTKLEQYDYPGATALALVMLAASFVILIAINGMLWRRRKIEAAPAMAPGAAARYA